MKKIDKLILTSFIGPFSMTFLFVVFILLSRHMLLYVDDIIGKDLGWLVLGELLFYFSLFMIPVAMPLAVLLSSLITFGNLAEHFELTAIKSAGISLLRTIFPIFVFVFFLSLVTLYLNNKVVPGTALEAFSLMYDIKQKKTAPFLVSIAFFVTYYVLNIQSENLATQKIVRPWAAVWIPPSIFLCAGFLLLRQARVDSRVFEADAYRILFDRFRAWRKTWR